MAQLKTHKFVAALPPELEADAIYFVRAGSGFDLYVTNHSGTIVAYPANGGTTGLGAYGELTGGFDIVDSDEVGGVYIGFADYQGTEIGTLYAQLDTYSPGEEFGEIRLDLRDPKTGLNRRALQINAETGKSTLLVRPSWKTTGGAEVTPWDSQNLDISSFAPKESPAFTGVPTAPIVTFGSGGVDAQIVTQKYVAGLFDYISTSFAKPVDISNGINTQRPKALNVFCSGKPIANEVIGSGIAPYAMTLVAASCKAQAVVAATASTVFTIKKNNTNIGTVTFSAAGTVGVFSITTAAVAVDNLITIHAPASADATLADITIQLRGT